MHKKARLRIKLKKGETAKVKKGDHVKSGDPFIESPKLTLYEFDIAKTLGVAPTELPKYLLVKEHTPVKKGDILAKKKGLLSRNNIKTPVAGTFIWIDQEKGIVGIRDDGEIHSSVNSWLDGEVEEVTPEMIVMSVSGTPVPGSAGRGGPASGKLTIVTEPVNVFTMPVDLESRVIAVREAFSDVIAKADALGAIAIVTEKLEEPPFTLPYLLVENIETLAKFRDMTVIVHGEQKELLILDERKHTKT